MASKFADVDLAALPLTNKPVKVDNVMVVPFEPVVRVQTDLVTATGPLTDENGDLLPNLYARASGPFLRFLRAFEDAVLEAAKANAQTWWSKKQCSPGLIENGFKSYFKTDDVFKINVKSTTEALVFDKDGNELGNDALGSNSKFWAVLEARRVVLGKTEFGMVWKLNQLMLKPAARCEVSPPPAVQAEDDGDFL